MEHEVAKKFAQFNVFAKLLSGDTKTLLFDTNSVCARAVKERIFQVTKIPISQQRLIYGGRQIDDGFVIPFPDSTVHLCLRLRGGKGGFGSLLRGAATKAGQKKTNNFDACRDMSGRRLRHVNAEKKLEEWKAEEEGRKLEKIAEEFIKKAAKKGKKGVGDGAAQKYVEKYREESAKCVARVELSVREAVGSSANLKRSVKRKLAADADMDGKKLKIWMGKRPVAGSDDDMEDDSSDDDEENEKSVVLDKSNSSDSTKDGDVSSDSMTGGTQDDEIAVIRSSRSGSEEEKETIMQEMSDSDRCSSEISISKKMNEMIEPKAEEEQHDEHGKNDEAAGQVVSLSSSGRDENTKVTEVPDVTNAISENQAKTAEVIASLPEERGEAAEAIVSLTAERIVEDKPLDFNDYDSAAQLEVLGLERLKSELQLRGLKCGGTSQERAARLFLLKSTPLDKIPKKLLAKK